MEERYIHKIHIYLEIQLKDIKKNSLTLLHLRKYFSNFKYFVFDRTTNLQLSKMQNESLRAIGCDTAPKVTALYT